MLNKYRKQIDKIDKKIIKLFEKRMDVSKCVGEYKREKGIAIFDAEREMEIIKTRTSQIKNPEYKEYAKDFFENLMSISKEMQNKK
jgi:chorismate mutase/prephenate dehydratase